MTETAPRRRRTRKAPDPVETQVSAEDAVRLALELGESVATVKDETGKEFTQRPVTLTADAVKPILKPGERVKVYNKRPTRLYFSDCVLEAHAEGMVLASDLKREKLAAKVIKVAS